MAIDYFELVDLVGVGPRGHRSATYATGGVVGRMTLAEAVRTVVEYWQGDFLRQASAAIVRDSGRAIMELKEIREIYARPDFPRI